MNGPIDALKRGGFIKDQLAQKMKATEPGKLALRLAELAYNSREGKEPLYTGSNIEIEIVKFHDKHAQYPDGVYKFMKEIEDYLWAAAFRDAQ